MSVALVLGGATGIGAAVVDGLRDRGDDVMVVDTNEAAARSLLGRAAPGRGAFTRVDLDTASGAVEAVDAALEFGGGMLDTVFYNAGVLEAHPLQDWTVADWDRTLSVNLRSPFFVAQRAAEALAASSDGRFILTSSTGAFRSHAGMAAYHASKAGGLGLIRALADELGPLGVTVNAVCPGWIDTAFNDGYWQHQSDPRAAAAALVDAIPLRRQGLPQDVVGAVLFLASPEARYITGQSIVVDGGYTAI